MLKHVFVKGGFLALALAAMLAAADSANAQQIVIPFPGGSHTIYPSAFAPGANVAIPGSQQFWRDPVTGASGFRYLGIDGRMHGTTHHVDPFTGQSHLSTYGPRGGSGGAYHGYNGYTRQNYSYPSHGNYGRSYGNYWRSR